MPRGYDRNGMPTGGARNSVLAAGARRFAAYDGAVAEPFTIKGKTYHNKVSKYTNRQVAQIRSIVDSGGTWQEARRAIGRSTG